MCYSINDRFVPFDIFYIVRHQVMHLLYNHAFFLVGCWQWERKVKPGFGKLLTDEVVKPSVFFEHFAGHLHVEKVIYPEMDIDKIRLYVRDVVCCSIL